MQETKNTRLTHAFQIGFLGALGVLTAVALGSAVISIAGIITSIITALFITLGLEPLVQLLQKRVKKRGLAIAIVGVGVFTALSAVVFAILPPLFSQANTFITNLPELMKEFVKLPWVESIDSRLDGAIGTALNGAGDFLVDSKNWPTLLGGVVQVGLSIFNGIIGFLTVTILTIYFMAALPSIKRVGISLVANSKRAKLEGIVEKVIGSVGRYVMGQVVVSSINTSILFTVLIIAGVDFAVVLAFINFLLVLIPIIGSITGAAIVILITAATSPTETTIGVAIALLLYIQIEAYLVSPRVLKRAVNVPTAVIIVSALVGGALAGILGSLLAIPTAATVLLIIREVWVPRQDKL
jgi:predicted PurR-regulated permease PerM